jgi:hypothetical protein
MLALLLAGCCGTPWDEPRVNRLQDFGRGAAAITVTNADNSTVGAFTLGVSTEDWEGIFADGQSGVITSESYPIAEGPPVTFDGFLYVQVCAPMPVDGCGDATVCFVSGWMRGDAIDGSAHSQAGGMLVHGEDFGTDSQKAEMDVRLHSVTSGEATVTAPTWREGADACFEAFTPAKIEVIWGFDEAPMSTDEAPLACG